jgi:hypothetical protein
MPGLVVSTRFSPMWKKLSLKAGFSINLLVFRSPTSRPRRKSDVGHLRSYSERSVPANGIPEHSTFPFLLYVQHDPHPDLTRTLSQNLVTVFLSRRRSTTRILPAKRTHMAGSTYPCLLDRSQDPSIPEAIPNHMVFFFFDKWF